MSKQIDYSLMGEEIDPFLDGIEEVAPYLFYAQPRTGNCDVVPLVMLSDFTPKNRVHERQGEEIDMILEHRFQGDGATNIRKLGLHEGESHENMRTVDTTQ